MSLLSLRGCTALINNGLKSKYLANSLRRFSLLKVIPHPSSTLTSFNTQLQSVRHMSRILPPTTYTDDNIKIVVREWAEKWVFGHKLCPFAGAVLKNDKMKIVVNRSASPTNESELTDFIHAILDDCFRQLGIINREYVPPTFDTTLVVLPRLKDFEEFTEIVNGLETMLRKLEIDGVIQIASFHPLFKFKPRLVDGEVDERAEDAYTNRSPYPIIHLLRVDDVTKAIRSYTEQHSPLASVGIKGRVKNRVAKTQEHYVKTLDAVWEKNVALMRSMGLAKIRRTLKDIYDNAPVKNTNL